jgi:hypothetical protein
MASNVMERQDWTGGAWNEEEMIGLERTGRNG